MGKNAVLVFLLSILSYVLPKYAYQLVKRMLFLPDGQEAVWPIGTKRLIYKTKYGTMRTYRMGQGKCIWLIHGWAETKQYLPLIQKLVDQGYCCIAMEFLPDVDDSAVFDALPQWTKVFQVSVKYLDKPQHVLAHGFAASIIGNSKWLKHYQGDLTLVSPVLDVQASLTSFLRAQGMSNTMLTCLKKDIENADLTSLSVANEVDNFQGNLSIFYSRSDETSTIRAIKSLSSKNNRKISEFKGASTSKIIDSKSLLFTVKQDAAKFDIAI